jgi:hypothetical protein
MIPINTLLKYFIYYSKKIELQRILQYLLYLKEGIQLFNIDQEALKHKKPQILGLLVFCQKKKLFSVDFCYFIFISI